MRNSVTATAPPTTPTSSRPFVGRILRSHTKRRTREKEEGSPKITGYFNVRKRLHHQENIDKVEELKKHRSAIITNAHAKTPPGLTFSDQTEPSTPELTNESGLSPPKRPRLPTSLGVFDIMSDFERFDFLASIPIEFFNKLALTSHNWATLISKYIKSKAWKNRFITMAKKYQCSDVSDNVQDPFTATGELLKAITIAKDTESRIEYMIKFVESVHADLHEVNGWFNFFRTFCRCWASNEKAKVVKAVKKLNGKRLERLFRIVLASVPGERYEEEMELRRLLRGYFVHPKLCSSTISSSEMHEAGFWLSCILKAMSSNSIVAHCRICLIIFTPVHVIDGKEQINYTSLVDQVVSSFEDVNSRLSPLAAGLSALLSLKERPTIGTSWKYDEIFNLIEEITTFPSPWSFDNFVAFLLTGKNLLNVAVITRVTHSHRQEAGQIINTMKTLIFRWGMDATEAMGEAFRQIVDQLNPAYREIFIRSVIDAHIEQYREYLQLGFGARDNCDEETASFMAFSPLFNNYLHYLRP